MRYSLLLLCVMVQVKAMAQQQKTAIKDSLPAKVLLKNSTVSRKLNSAVTLEATIETELNKIAAAYITEPNTAATWTQIKTAADNYLYTYFRDGKLLGAKKEQAFYVKMGTETMTAADIANKKMILIAGIATVKPAEFIVIRVEKTGTR